MTGKSAFISLSFAHRDALRGTVRHMTTVLQEYGIAVTVFVDKYAFGPNEEETMMQVSAQCIAQCDFVIAEVSQKAIGVGVEVGYARGLGKPVIYMRHQDADHSTTVAGISTHQIIYTSVADMVRQLRHVLDELLEHATVPS